MLNIPFYTLWIMVWYEEFLLAHYHIKKTIFIKKKKKKKRKKEEEEEKKTMVQISLSFSYCCNYQIIKRRPYE